MLKRQNRMRQNLVCLILLMLSATFSMGQPLFQKRYGSHFHDKSRKVIQTIDNNYIVVGGTYGFGSSENALLMKIDSIGSTIWIKDYSGINEDAILDIIELPNKNLVMCGYTSSFGAGSTDGFVMETDSIGTLIWAKAYGDIFGDACERIIEDGSGGYYVASYAQESTGTLGSSVMRIDASGNILWNKWVANYYMSRDITSISSGGVLLSCSHSGTGPGFTCWKFSSSGVLIWSTDFMSTTGSSSADDGMSILENSIGDFFINFGIANLNTVAQSVDNCIVKLSSSGSVISYKSYGGIYTDWSSRIKNTSDGGILLLGNTNSAGNGDYDICLIKLLSSGSVQWAKAYGTVWLEIPTEVGLTIDGGYIITGESYSTGTISLDSTKIYLVKTDSLGNSACNAITWNPIQSNQTYSTGPAPTPVNFSFLQDNGINWNLNNRSLYSVDICNPVSVSDIPNAEMNWNIYPNPFSTQTTIQTDIILNDATLTVDNYLGQTIKEIKNISEQTVILSRDNLPSGLYFVRLSQYNKVIGTKKLLITD
jgi:hypothetical protein